MTDENDVYVNSSSSSAISTGGSASISAPNFFIVGNHSGSLTGTVHTGQTALTDPLSFLPYPDSSQLTVQSTSTYATSGTATLKPGVYNGGISLSSGANVSMDPGLYYLVGGGFTVGSHASVVGSEVTIFIADSATSTINISGGASAQLSPPSDGVLKGLTVFFHRDNASTVNITGGGNLKIYGSIYVPSANVTLGGNGVMIAGSQIVAQAVTLQGNSVTQITTAGGLYALPPGCFAP
jgi:hypothetical protein